MASTSPGRMPVKSHQSADIGQQVRHDRQHRLDGLIGNRADRGFLASRRAILLEPRHGLEPHGDIGGISSSDAAQAKQSLIRLTDLLIVVRDHPSAIMSSRTVLSFFGPNSVTGNSRNRQTNGRSA